MTDERMETDGGTTGRRALLAGAGAIGASAVLAACGTDDSGRDPSSSGSEGPGGSPSGSPPAATGSAEPGGDSGEGDRNGGDGPNGEPLAATGEVEVGGGVVLAAQEIVVTRPAEGEWRGFTSTCTHQGCTVSSVADGTINCGCHGSMFSIDDGSVVNGPATAPLGTREVTSDGEHVYLA